MILRFAVLAFLVDTNIKTCLGQDNRPLLDIIDEIFGKKPSADTPLDQRCDTIGGPLSKEGGSGKYSSCFDCYGCDDDEIAARKPSDINKLALNTESCDRSIELCCVRQPPLTLRNRIGGACGVGNPNGAALSVRRSAGEVLAGEYPWTAALYRKASSSPEYLCAATLVSPAALVTTARCLAISEASPDELLVRLGADGTDYDGDFFVKELVSHDGYTNAGLNDVAVLTLTESSRRSLPKWATPVCLPDAPTLPDTPCVTVVNKRTLYSRVVQRFDCEDVLKSAGVTLHASQMCSLANYPSAPAPKHAASLMCQDDGTSEWTLRGLASFRGDLIDGLQLYTDVHHLAKWIETTMRELNAQ